MSQKLRMMGLAFVVISIFGVASAGSAQAVTPNEGPAKLKGNVAAQVLSPASGVLATNLELETSQAISQAAGTKLLYGARESFLDSKVDVHLESDGNWGVDW